MKQGRGEVSYGSSWGYCGFQAGAGKVTVGMVLISIYMELWDPFLDHAVESRHLVDNSALSEKFIMSLVRGSLWSHWRSPSMCCQVLSSRGCVQLSPCVLAVHSYGASQIFWGQKDTSYQDDRLFKVSHFTQLIPTGHLEPACCLHQRWAAGTIIWFENSRVPYTPC